MFPTFRNCVKLALNAQYMVLTFTERKDNQTSNKLNTIAIPLAATPLCMVANIVLVLPLGGGNIPPNLIYITISSHETLLYTLHYYFLLPCRGWRTYKQLCCTLLICLEIFSTWCVAVIIRRLLKRAVNHRSWFCVLSLS